MNKKKILFIIIMISFILKMIAGFYLSGTFMKRGNSHTALNKLAYNVVEHGEYSIKKGIPSIDYEPLYPHVMVIGYFIFGFNWIGLTIIQGLLFALTTLLIFNIGKIVWNDKAGLIAALFYSFYPYLFTYSLSIYDTTLFNFFLYLLIYLIVRRTRVKRDYFIFGIITGLTLLTRGSILVLLPVFFGFLLFQLIKTKNLKNIVLSCSLVVLGIFLITSPWLIRNYFLTGKITISAHGSFGLWQGNNELSYEYLKNNISLDNIYRNNPEIYRNNPIGPKNPKETLKVAEVYKKAAIKFIKENPGEFIKLAYIKFIKFWSWQRNPTSSKPVYGSNKLREVTNYISYGPLLFFMPFGAFFLYKKDKELFLIFLSLISFYTAAHMIVMGFTRARLPLDPILMILFGITFERFLQNNTILKRFKNLIKF